MTNGLVVPDWTTLRLRRSAAPLRKRSCDQADVDRDIPERSSRARHLAGCGRMQEAVRENYRKALEKNARNKKAAEMLEMLESPGNPTP